MTQGLHGRRTWQLMLLLPAALTAVAGESVRSVDIVEAAAFLEAYRTASDAQSAEFYDLYSDRAVIHARARDHVQGIAIEGKAFKTWGRQILSVGPGSLDGSVFREATVEQRGERLLIRAKRYSSTRCYWDLSYLVGIEKEGNSYRIVEERLTTDPAARCSSDRTVFMDMPRGTAALPAQFTSPTEAPKPRQGEGSIWHPLSEEELKYKAQQLAQQMASERSRSAPAVAARVGFISAGGSLGDSGSKVPVQIVNAPSDLHVTPPE
jgi:hypothetical protein